MRSSPALSQIRYSLFRLSMKSQPVSSVASSGYPVVSSFDPSGFDTSEVPPIKTSPPLPLTALSLTLETGMSGNCLEVTDPAISPLIGVLYACGSIVYTSGNDGLGDSEAEGEAEGLAEALGDRDALADWLVADDLAQGRLVPLFPDWQVSATGFESGAWALYPSRTYMPTRLRVMLDYLSAHLGSASHQERARSAQI